MTDKHPHLKDSDFLLPSERRYPYKENGRVSANLLTASIKEARTAQDNLVVKRGEVIYTDTCE